MKKGRADFHDPVIIQGGMGVAISTWSLARTVSKLGMLGTVSGVALERVVAIILQLGDPGGHFRRALDHFPYPEVAERIRREFYVEDGIEPGKSFRPCPMFTLEPSKLLIELTVFANFAAVWLAKEGHNHPISINYLEKIQMPHMYALYGAMLAGVDVVTVGAGIPLQFVDLFANATIGRPMRYRVDVVPDVSMTRPPYREMIFDPKEYLGEPAMNLNMPRFIPIISSSTLAKILIKRLPKGSIYGFVVETDTAGGHNAPPRKKIAGKIHLSPSGEPVYGPGDCVDYTELVKLCKDSRIKFWIGGSMASPEHLADAKALGAAGIQVGTMFALANESGLDPSIKAAVRRLGFRGESKVITSMWSPTGFPFKVIELPGTVSEPSVYSARDRVCAHGALVTLYERPDGSIGYRCSAEPVEDYFRKGGKLEDTIGMRCICSGLLSTAGYCRNGPIYEPPIVTVGDNLGFLKHLMKGPDDQPSEFGSYTVADAQNYLLGTS